MGSKWGGKVANMPIPKELRIQPSSTSWRRSQIEKLKKRLVSLGSHQNCPTSIPMKPPSWSSTSPKYQGREEAKIWELRHFGFWNGELRGKAEWFWTFEWLHPSSIFDFIFLLKFHCCKSGSRKQKWNRLTQQLTSTYVYSYFPARVVFFVKSGR